MACAKAKPWPNGSGWMVGRHEVLKRDDGRLHVRLFKAGDRWHCHKAYLADAEVTDPLEAVKLALKYGSLVE